MRIWRIVEPTSQTRIWLTVILVMSLFGCTMFDRTATVEEEWMFGTGWNGILDGEANPSIFFTHGMGDAEIVAKSGSKLRPFDQPFKNQASKLLKASWTQGPVIPCLLYTSPSPRDS